MKTATILSGCAALTLVASMAVGQVVPSQTGQALDASTRVGSGGYNSVRGNARINSQLYVNGQVTGLAGFRGETGYFAENQFRLDLPSASLGTFRQQSVGLSDASGSIYAPSPYFRRSTTVLGAADIAAGRTSPGSNIPRTSRAAPELIRGLYREATRDYIGLVPQQGSESVGVRGLRPLVTAPLSSEDLIRTAPMTTMEEREAFAHPGEMDRRNLAGDIYKTLRLEAQVDPRVEAEIDAILRSVPQEPEETLPVDSEKPHGNLDRSGLESSQDMPTPDEDVFIDLLLHFKRLRGEGEKTPPEDDRQPSDWKPDETDRIVELSTTRGIVIHRFAGTGRDQFNRRMARARAFMGNGQYYDAVAEYRYAIVANPSNPLAHAGLALSYLAAGEQLTAAVHLRTAFVVFPPVMQTQVEVSEIIGQTVLKHRLDELDKLVEAQGPQDKTALVFLQTFLHYNAGRQEEAKLSARALKQLAPKDKIYTAYATYVLTGTLPTADKAKTKQTKKEK